MFHLALLYFNEGKYTKVEQLIDQFCLQDFETQIYRQFKMLQILILKMRLYQNIKQQPSRALECADFLAKIVDNLMTIELPKEEQYGMTNQTVKEILLSQPDKLALFMLQAGICYSIFSDSTECNLYFKRKIMKQKALEIFKKAALIHVNNINACFYLCLTLAELGKIDHAKQILNDCLEIEGLSTEGDQNSMLLVCLLMIHAGQLKQALRLIKHGIKK